MKDIKFAFYHQYNSFSKAWIEFCEERGIPYKIVNPYAYDIIEQLDDCDAFMWHWHHNDHRAKLFAKQLLYSLEIAGKKVFPDTHSVWHFDDKIGQKYLLESVKAPFINTYVFYDRSKALAWAKGTTYPKVFKLRGGAASANVFLIKSYEEAERFINKAFSKGFGVNRLNPLKERIWKYKQDKTLKNFIDISIRGGGRYLFPNKKLLALPVEKNYLYAQDFIPNNDHDIRVTVFGKRALAIKRMTRADDFRASGSGDIRFDKKEIPIECVKLAFDVNKRIKASCTSFDFVFDEEGRPLIVEISYGFDHNTYRNCPGYWDENLNWIEGHFIIEHFIIEDILKGLLEGED